MSRFARVFVLALVAGLPSLCCGQWYGSVDFMVPIRSVDATAFQRNIVVTETKDDAGVVIDTVYAVGTENLLKLDLGFVSGGRATVGYQSDLYGLEGTFMFTDQWDTVAAVSDSNGLLASPFSIPGFTPDPIFDFNTFAAVAYKTELQSAEFNLTYQAYEYENGQAVCKFGMRAMSIDEAFEYSSSNVAVDNTLVSTARNRMIGPQFGVRGNTPAPGGHVALSASGLFAYNDIDRTSVLNGSAVNWNTGEASLVGEVAIEYLFVPASNVAVRIGYQLLGVANVGLATKDPLISDQQTGGVVYQMPYVGVLIVR